MMKRIARISLTLLGLAGFTGCAGTGEPNPDTRDRVHLHAFRTCDDLLDSVREEALEHVGPYGLDGGYGGWGFGGEGGDTGAEDAAGGDSGGGDGGQGFSGTNVQELGVDEPDIVKTDGDRILAVAQGQVHLLSVDGGNTALLSSVGFGGEEYGYGEPELLLQGDRALVMVQRWDVPEDIFERPAADALGPDYGYYYGPVTQIAEVDLSNPAQIRVVSSLWVKSDYVSARLVDGVARLVLRGYPSDLPFKYPDEFFDSGSNPYDEYGGWDDAAWQRAERRAEDHNRGVIKNAEVSDFVPAFVHEDHLTGQTERGQLVPCENAYQPGTFSGFNMLSVITVDMNRPLALADAVGVFSSGETVYASQESLFVATHAYYEGDPENGFGVVDQTESLLSSYVHKFDIRDPGITRYAASGAVPGYLLSQWSMSEHEGDLRVATTDWSNETESFVTVLRERGEDLLQVGQVGGLGRGEQIYAVRFMGDIGYVVTFRQIDPLYTVDLSKPTQPRVAGELKIEGYSAYLHPVGDGLLLGVGRDGTAEGQVLGTAISLFDVSNPADPQRLHHQAFGESGSSDVEFDHRAFLYWGPAQTAVFPVWSYDFDPETGNEEFFGGALGYRIDANAGIELIGQIEHEMPSPYGEYWGSNIRRSLVVGDTLFTLSSEGLMASDLGQFGQTGWVGF